MRIVERFFFIVKGRKMYALCYYVMMFSYLFEFCCALFQERDDKLKEEEEKPAKQEGIMRIIYPKAIGESEEELVSLEHRLRGGSSLRPFKAARCPSKAARMFWWGSDCLLLFHFQLPSPTLYLPLSMVKPCLAAKQQARAHSMRFVVLGGRQTTALLSGRHFMVEVIYYTHEF
jgi:hypothetical protein